MYLNVYHYFMNGRWVDSWVSTRSTLMEGLPPSVFSIQSLLFKQLSLCKHSLFYACFTTNCSLQSVALLMLTKTKNKVGMNELDLCYSTFNIEQ